jgi:DNA repair protein RecO (recombination protein O)
MRVSDKAIILQAIKYGDKKFILKLQTWHHGLVTVAAVVGKAASAKIKSGSILPLSLVEVQLVLKQSKEVHQLSEATCYSIHDNIHQSLSKLGIAQFINEILIKSLKEQQGNAHLFEFIETCLKFLNDAEKDYENLHLYFLIELTRYLGFEPHNNYTPQSPYFDCREGRFSALAMALPLGLNKEDSLLFSMFLKENMLKAKMPNGQRQRLLEILLAYYRLHVPGFNEVKSLEVLREVMAG